MVPHLKKKKKKEFNIEILEGLNSAHNSLCLPSFNPKNTVEVTLNQV